MKNKIMETTKYTTKSIHNINNIDELNEYKTNFLKECKLRENKIAVGELLNKVTNFIIGKTMFESMIPSLLSKKGGKTLINDYTKVIKENKSLKTLYAYHEGLNENKTTDEKKNYITEALSIGKPIQYNEYVNGVGKIVNIISEAFKILGDEFVLENIKINETAENIGDSLVYLSTTNKNIKNLNEYFSHINILGNNIIKEDKKNINVDNTLEEVVKEINENKNNINDIFETEDKKTTFEKCKSLCLEMFVNKKKNNKDIALVNKLTEMENKLCKKVYNYDTFTKDMLYMTELQELLK